MTARLVKEAAEKAFEKKRRGMTAISLVEELPELIDRVNEWWMCLL